MNNLNKMLFALVAIAITVGYLWQTHRAGVPKQATWDDVLAEANAGGYRLISTSELWPAVIGKHHPTCC